MEMVKSFNEATHQPTPTPTPVAPVAQLDSWEMVEADKKALSKRKAKLIKGLGEIDSDDERAVERRTHISVGISNADSLRNKEGGFRLSKEALAEEEKVKEEREDAINTDEQREELGEQVKTCKRIKGFVVRDTKGSDKVPAKTTATLTMEL
jgi:hypothetical protein